MSESDKTIIQPPNKGVLAVYRSKGQLVTANFLGGMAWGVGSVLGATIIVATILFLFNLLGGVPIIGSFITEITESISDGMNR